MPVRDRPDCATVRPLGADTEVMCADGRMRRYVNLDYAASTPALPEVWEAVEAFMPVVQQRPPRQRHEVAGLDGRRSRARARSWRSSSARRRPTT